MISVLTLRYHPAVGGVETTVLEITTRLAKYFDIKVITSDLKVERPFEKLAGRELLSQHQGVPITRLRARKFLPLEGYGVLMGGISDAIKGSELIHVHSYGTYHADKAIKVAARTQMPSVLTAYLHPASHSHHKTLRTVYDSTMGKRTLNRCSYIITLTNNERDYIADRFGVPKEKIVRIPSGIDLGTYRDMGLKREPNSLLFVGRLSPVKRLDMLLEAVKLVKDKVPDVKLKIAGRDWGERPRLAQLTKHLGLTDNVDFLGEMAHKDLVEQYNRAWAFVMTSRFETFGVTLMEAIGCQTPVVVTGVGGVSEVVGSAGIVCRESPEDVARGIIELLTNDKRYYELKENTKTQREMFGWESVVEGMKKLYEKALEGR